MKKIRKGNDIVILWKVFDAHGGPYSLTGASIKVYLVVAGRMILVSSPTVDENKISFTYAGKDQQITGMYGLLLVQNDGHADMVTHDVQDAFSLVPHSWLTGGHGRPDVDVVSVEVSSELNITPLTAEEIIEALGYTPLKADDISGKADKAIPAAAGNIAILDGEGNLADGGKKVSDLYQKPASGIPASDIADGVIPDVSNFITKTVDDLVNYYLKSDTYTKSEVAALIGAIQHFHYEVYASTSAVTNPSANVLYLIGPSGTGTDKYEEYVYDATKQSPWIKIGDTSIDLSDYATISAMNTALARKQDVIADLVTIRTNATSALQPADVNGEDIDVNEDGKLQFANRAYNSQTPNGMGYKILRKDATFSSQVTDTNTIYEIRYDFNLDGGTKTIPSGCALRFNGGSISNAILVGTHTRIEAGLVKIFDSVTFSGTFDVNEQFPQWFGVVADNSTDNSSAFQASLNAVNLSKRIRIIGGIYRFNSTVSILETGIELHFDVRAEFDYYGSSHFFIIGSSNTRVGGKIVGGLFYVKTSDCEDVFHLVSLAHFTFDSLFIDYGKTAFNTYHSDYKGAYYVYFLCCRVTWTKGNGIDIRPYGTAQTNQIQLIRCSVGSSGNPTLHTHTNIKDTENGNGYVIGGTAISVLNCASEVNNGYGFKIPDDATAYGINIITMYSEQNLAEPVYVGYGSNKRNITVEGLYDSGNARPFGHFDLIESDAQNLRIEGWNEEYQFGAAKLRDEILIAFRDLKFVEFRRLLYGLHLPAKYRYHIKSGHGATYFYIASAFVFNGHLLLVSAPPTSTEAKTITAINGNTITFDSALSANRNKISIITDKHPFYCLGTTELLAHPVMVNDVQPGRGYNAAATVGRTLSAGDTTVELTSAMMTRWSSVKVGDVIYFGSGYDYHTVHTVSLSSYTEKEGTIAIGEELAAHKFADKVCAYVITNLARDAELFDFFSAHHTS